MYRRLGLMYPLPELLTHLPRRARAAHHPAPVLLPASAARYNQLRGQGSSRVDLPLSQPQRPHGRATDLMSYHPELLSAAPSCSLITDCD